MKSRRITAALLLAACGAGIRSTAKNDEGIPELTLYNETTVAFAEALHDLYFDKIGAVCETMAFRSYKTVISAYCETALKVKYSRDCSILSTRPRRQTSVMSLSRLSRDLKR